MNQELEIVIKADVNSAVTNIDKVGKSLAKVNDTAKKSGKDFTGLSRVIQDLPYGFNAISNNLTEIIPAAAGAGLAFSAIVSAITFAQIGFRNWTRGLGESEKALSAYNEELAKTTSSTNTEIAKIQGLVGVAKDLSNSTDTRKNAIKELQKEYPGYLSNINLENINSQEATNAINGLTAALTRKAKVQAITNLLTKANEELTKAQTTSAKEQASFIDKTLLKLSKGGVFAFGAQSGANKAKADAIKVALDQVNTYTDALNKALDEQATNNDFSLLDPTRADKSTKKTKEFIRRNFSSALADIQHDPLFFEEFSIINDTIQTAIDNGPPLKIPPFDFDKTDVGQKIAAIAETIRSTMESALEGIGESLGNLFSGQKNPFANIFNIIGEGLKSIGKQLIVVGQLGQAIQKALALLLKTPAAAIAVGIAAIALGTVITNLANKSTKAFASGGVVTSPTLALVGEQGPERITPLGYEGANNAVMQGEVIFTISGQTLRGILRRADQSAYNTF